MSKSADAGWPARDRDQLSDDDKSILGQARKLARGSEPAAVRAYFEWDEPLARSQSGSGDQAGVIPASPAMAPGGAMRTRPCAYKITFTGRAGDTLRTAFDDCTVTLGPGTTTLCAQLPEPAALWGLVERITGLGLELVDLHLVAPEPGAGST